ncbi:MAG: amidohydrolase [Anaerolineales bacterium]|nr:amidohydrolase [Anaerolineales bacterium]
MTGTLLTHATIYTLDDHQPTAAALAVDHGRIMAIGDADPLLAEFGSRFRVEDLHGLVILPGLTDAHLHLQHYALGLAMVDCETSTRAEALQRIAERARQTPPGEWVRGQGFNHNVWPEGAGNVLDLDAVSPHNPVYITHKSLHSAWVNSLALERAGLSGSTPDPTGARLGRTPDGSLDGLLYETAMDLVSGVIPKPTVAQLAHILRQTLPNLHQMGLTGVHDFDRRDCFAALQSLHAAGELNLRVLKSIPLEDLPLAAGLGLRQGFGDDLLRIGSVKAFMDGALGPQTAAMLAPYEGSSKDLGILSMDSEEIFEHARLAAEHGLSMAVHAIGDRAVHEILDAFEHLRTYEQQYLNSPNLRHRIEHVQLIHPADAGRLAELRVIASMQPLHATSDMFMADHHWGARAAFSYAWRTQLEAGARLAFGSDAPVETPNPFLGLHAAVTRRRADGAPGEQGWYPSQRLTVLEALHGYTTGPAYAAGMEDRLGKLAPGYLADLIVLDVDPFNCDPHQLQFIQPLRTMVAGNWVFCA